MPRLATFNDVPTVFPPMVFPDIWNDPETCFWKKRIDDLPVNEERTHKLRLHTGNVDFNEGNWPDFQRPVNGVPINVVTPFDREYKVWDIGAAGWIPWPWVRSRGEVRMALPQIIFREGDPHGAYDAKYRGYDPELELLYEGLQFRWQGWPFNRWQVGYSGGSPMAIWDLKSPWDDPGQPKGTVAAKIPHLPMVVQWHEVEDGEIPHALSAAFPNYSSERPTGAARGSDGTIPFHPVRAGERLRLRKAVFDRMINDPDLNKTDRVFVVAARRYGLHNTDKTTHDEDKSLSGDIKIMGVADRRFQTGTSNTPAPSRRHLFKAYDFEIVVQ